MEYRQYGAGGPEISCLGFGVMRLPSRKRGDWTRVHFTRSTALLRQALDTGVNFFDSHHGYHGGNSEVAIGRALKGWKGQKTTIQTKTPWYKEEPTEFFERLLYEALEKLGVNCIDYLLHHSMNMEMWTTRGRKFIKFTDWAMNRGLIKHRGFSSHDKPENVKSFIDTGEFSAMLLSYNWMNPTMRDTIAYGADKGLGVSIMNPIGGGALATSTPQILRLLPGSASAAEVGMRYVLATPGVTCALSGMNTSEQLDENIRTASRRRQMTAKQLENMQERLQRIENRSKQFCTGCGYCMPCPHGVDIAGNFRLLNQVRFFGRLDWARQQLTKLARDKDGDKSASACRRCGSCEPKCPNNVPIMRQLEHVASELGSDS